MSRRGVTAASMKVYTVGAKGRHVCGLRTLMAWTGSGAVATRSDSPKPPARVRAGFSRPAGMDGWYRIVGRAGKGLNIVQYCTNRGTNSNNLLRPAALAS